MGFNYQKWTGEEYLAEEGGEKEFFNRSKEKRGHFLQHASEKARQPRMGNAWPKQGKKNQLKQGKSLSFLLMGGRRRGGKSIEAKELGTKTRRFTMRGGGIIKVSPQRRKRRNWQ